MITDNNPGPTIDFCETHRMALMSDLCNHNLQERMSLSEEERLTRLRKGEMDIREEATHEITINAIKLLGIDAILRANCCPVCAFQQIITYTSSELAKKYQRAN